MRARVRGEGEGVRARVRGEGEGEISISNNIRTQAGPAFETRRSSRSTCGCCPATVRPFRWMAPIWDITSLTAMATDIASTWSVSRGSRLRTPRSMMLVDGRAQRTRGGFQRFSKFPGTNLDFWTPLPPYFFYYIPDLKEKRFWIPFPYTSLWRDRTVV